MPKTEHLTKEELISLDTSPNKLILLEHIGSCPLCSGRLAQTLLGQDMISAPHYLKQNILAKGRQLKQKKKEFHIYCMKIGFAVAASLAVILLSDAADISFMEIRPQKTYMEQTTQRQDISDIHQRIYRSTDKLNQKIINFTDSLFHTK